MWIRLIAANFSHPNSPPEFALAVLPVSAETITTGTEGLEAGEVSIPTSDRGSDKKAAEQAGNA